MGTHSVTIDIVYSGGVRYSLDAEAADLIAADLDEGSTDEDILAAIRRDAISYHEGHGCPDIGLEFEKDAAIRLVREAIKAHGEEVEP